MRDLSSKAKAAVQTAGDGTAVNNPDMGFGRVDNEKRKLFNFVTDDICSAILNVSFQRSLKREKVPSGTALTLELWSDEFEGKGEFSQYRARLVSLTWIVECCSMSNKRSF